MSRTKHKPMTPEQVMLRAAERRAAEKEADRKHEWGVNTTVLALAANQNVTATMEKVKTTKVQTAKRLDAFSALQDTLSIGEYVCARRLQNDIVTRQGEGDKGRSLDKVDNPTGMDKTDAMIAAAERIEAVFCKMGEHDQWLLTELSSPSPTTRLRFHHWRDIVSHITGEENDRAQAGAVRSACRNLAKAYARIDNGAMR